MKNIDISLHSFIHFSAGIVFGLPITIAHPETLPLEPSLPPAGMSPPPVPYPHALYASPQLWANGEYPPLEPPRPLYADPAASTPPSPQFFPYTSPHLPGAVSLPQIPAGPGPYFPHYASQPTTPLQGNHAFVQGTQYTTPPPQSMYPPNVHLQHAGLTHALFDGHRALPQPLGAPLTQSSPQYIVATRTGPVAGYAANMQNTESQAPGGVGTAYEGVGKGAQAARVAQHLRQTSRTRSASPTPHRFTLPPPIQTPAQVISAPKPLESPTRPQLLSPTLSSSSALGSPTKLEIATGLTQPIGLHSPRPRLSPRLSFDERSTPQGMKIATLKSKAVEDLERRAEEVLRDANPPETRPTSAPTTPSRKTLPKIPESKLGSQQLVDGQTGAGVDAIPPKPTSSTIVLHNLPPRPLPSQPDNTEEHETALDALERRLAGPSWEKMDAAERWLTSNRRKADSAKLEGTAGHRSRREPSGPRNENIQIPGIRESGRDRETGRPRKESGLPPMPVPQPIELTKEITDREQEVYKLQKEAVQRVGQWAVDVSPTVEPEFTPWTTLTNQVIPKRSSGFIDTKKPGPPIDPRPPLKELFEPPNSGGLDHPTTQEDPTTVHPIDNANGHSLAPARPEQTTLLRPSPLLVPSRPYDVRSARGGKGGLVTSVTALWERGPGEPTIAENLPLAPATAPFFKMPGLPASASHPRMTPQSGNGPNRPDKSKVSPVFQSSASDPMINRTIAKPYLPSAASLVNPGRNPPAAKVSLIPRSPPVQDSRKSLSPVKPAIPSSPPSSTPGVGQARLRDLIAKYQNPA